MDDALKTMVTNMPEKTGKPLEDWLKILSEQELEKHGEMLSYLKKEHGISHGFANTIVHLYRDQTKTKDPGVDPVLEPYKGKEHLIPILNALKSILSGFGPDVEFSPKKSYLSIRTGKQFALIQPSTKSRVDLGLMLRDKEPEGKLEASGSFSAMCTHRIRLSSTDDIDKEVKGWLQEAYIESH